MKNAAKVFKGVLVVLILFSVGFSCAIIQKEYYNEYKYKSITDIRDGLISIQTKGKYTDGEEVEMNGTAIAIREDLVLALTHVCTLPRKIAMPSPFGMIEIDKDVEYEKNYINGKEVELVKRVDDVSLFKAEKLTPIGFELGDSDSLEIGTKVFMVGWSGLKERNFKQGIVSVLDLTCEEWDSKEFGLGKDMFMHTAPTNPGDSGSPLFARKGNKYEIVGIINAKYFGYDGMGFAIRINFIKNLINDIRED